MGDIPNTSQPPVETTPEEKPAEYSYNDVHKETPKEIIENKEIPEEKKEEEKKEEIKPEIKEEVLDTGKLAEEVAEKVIEKTKPPVEEEKPKTEDEQYVDWANKFSEEHGKEPTWTDVAKHLKEEAIKDKDNPSDQGVIERKELFKTMLEVNAKRAEENKRPIYSIKEIYYEHYKKPNAQPAGEDAPISMGKGTSPQGEGDQELDYNKDVKRTTWGELRNILGKKQG